MNASLTARERECLREVAAGLENEAIAQMLGIAIGTVKVHLMNAYVKLGAANRAHAAAIAVREGIA